MTGSVPEAASKSQQTSTAAKALAAPVQQLHVEIERLSDVATVTEQSAAQLSKVIGAF